MDMIVNSRESFMFVNVDNRLFQIVRNSEYVDKSEIITLTNQVIDSEDRFICVTRPRRFGKSVTVKMLTTQKAVIQRHYSLI